MIVSRQNSLIKLIRSLSDKKNRDREGLYIAEGFKTLKECVLLNCDIYKIVCTQKGLTLIEDICKNRQVELVSDDVFLYISGEVTPQGVMAIIKKPSLQLEKSFGKCLFLDGVSDSANVGAIIRTAAACGINQVYIADGADAYSPKSVRASMGGIFRVKVYVGEKEQLLSALSLPIVVADMHGKNVFDCNIKGDFCLVIGNEAHGVSDLLKQSAKHIVSIPMQNGMESLNASVSAGILMYELSK